MASDAFHAVVAYVRDTLDLTNVDTPLDELRARMSGSDGVLAPLPGVTATNVAVGGVPALQLDPDAGADDAVLLYLHGGGYCMGSPASHRNLTSHLARALGCRVVSLDYRLAPQHPFPAALHDALDAYRALAARYRPGRIAVAGDSAGGGLTMALLVALRDAGDPLPAAAVPISPWVDLTAAGGSMRTKADVDPMCSQASSLRMAGLYLAGHDPADPLASPLFAPLGGLPPLLVHVGECEVLLDDSTRLAAAARAAGVDCTLEVFPEMIHVFHAFVGIVPEADAAVAAAAAFLRGHLALPNPEGRS